MNGRLPITLQIVLALLLAIALPLFFIEGAYGRHLITITLIFCSLAVSLNLVMGYAGLVSVAHGAFFGIGAYCTALLTVNQFSFITSVLAGIVLAASVGTLVGLLTLRLRGHYFALSTLAFTMVGVIILERWDEVTRGARGVSNIPRAGSFSIAGFDISFKEFWPNYLLVTGVFLLFVMVSNLIIKSPFGRALLCIQRNELLGAVYGVNIVKVKLQVLALSAAMASVSGSLYASYIAYVSPNDATFMRSFEAIMSVVIGGTGTIWGPALGSFFIQLSPELLRGFESGRLLILGLILILIVRFYPSGLAGLSLQLWQALKVALLTRKTSKEVVHAVKDKSAP
ncbi:MAG: branched-chain amino acid ABC transporter permease [Alcaligenaceae bacterium]